MIWIGENPTSPLDDIPGMWNTDPGAIVFFGPLRPW